MNDKDRCGIRLLSQREAAEHLGVARATLRRLTRRGVIRPAGGTRNAVLFDIGDVEALAAQLTPERVPFQSRLVSTSCKRIN